MAVHCGCVVDDGSMYRDVYCYLSWHQSGSDVVVCNVVRN